MFVYKHDAVPQKSACTDKPSCSVPNLVTRGKMAALLSLALCDEYWAQSRRGDGMHALVNDPYLCCRSAAKVVCLPS